MELREPGQTAPEVGTVECVVLDFDGTLTDADAHAALFQAASREQLAQRLGMDANRMEAEWQRAEAMLQDSPEELGWEVDGYEVCPARADPYLIANSITQSLLEQYCAGDSPQARRVIVGEVHAASYQSVLPSFRQEARTVLETLIDLGRAVCVVTNSQTDTVRLLLDRLGVRGREQIRVQGGAGKFAVCGPTRPDARFDALPATVAIAAMHRKIHVHRGRYFDVLQGIWEATSTSPETTLVAGDIFELDLAMPAMLGAHVHLVTRAATLTSERAAVGMLRRGAHGPLASVIERV